MPQQKPTWSKKPTRKSLGQFPRNSLYLHCDSAQFEMFMTGCQRNKHVLFLFQRRAGSRNVQWVNRQIFDAQHIHNSIVQSNPFGLAVSFKSNAEKRSSSHSQVQKCFSCSPHFPVCMVSRRKKRHAYSLFCMKKSLIYCQMKHKKVLYCLKGSK